MTPRMVILAAGEGKRLRPLTEDKPKCMIEVAGKTLLQWQMEAAGRLGLEKVAVVTGYRSDLFDKRSGRWYDNPDYLETNMVETLWCARPEFQGEMIVSYGDILYEDCVLQSLVAAEGPISVVVDIGWRPYWEARFPDPLSDAESLRLDEDGRIVEIGQKVSAIEEVQGQYVGLMKFGLSGIEALQETYLKLKDNGVVGRSRRPFRKMHMTDLLQEIVEAGYRVDAVAIERRWIEIDSLADYQLARQHVRPGTSGPVIEL